MFLFNNRLYLFLYRTHVKLTGEHQLLVNSKFCEKMHWTDSPIGKQVNDYGRVVGLLDSFAFPGTPNDDVPVMIEWISGIGFCMEVRLKAPFNENLQKLNEEMKHLYPQDELTFLSIEQTISDYAASVRIFRNVTLWASVTILLIVMMGLMGYANDEIRLRSKEIAIRKVNGAETSDILRLLSQEVLWLAVPSVLLGVFGAYKTGQIWIGRFKDIVPLPVVGYVIVGCLLLAFIVGCVLLKTWYIAKENPVRSIRNEWEAVKKLFPSRNIQTFVPVNFTTSKPASDCFLLGMEVFGSIPSRMISLDSLTIN